MSASKTRSVRFAPNIQHDLGKPLVIHLEGATWKEESTTIDVFEMDVWQGKRNAPNAKDDLLATFQGKLKKIGARKYQFTPKASAEPVLYGKKTARTDGKPPIKIAFGGSEGTVYSIPLVSQAGENEGQHWEVGIEVKQGGKSVFKTKWPGKIDTGLSVTIHDGVSEKAIANHPFILLVGEGETVHVTRGKLDAQSRLVVHPLPLGKIRVLCLVEEELPGKFEKLAETPNALHWSRIFSLRAAEIPRTRQKDKAVLVHPKDDYLKPFIDALRKIANARALDTSFWSLTGKRKRDTTFPHGDATELAEWCQVAAAFHLGLSKDRTRKLSVKRSNTLRAFMSAMLVMKDDYRLGMGYGKLLGMTKSPDVVQVASQCLVWTMARAIDSNKTVLEDLVNKKAGSLPNGFPCFSAALALAAPSVEKKKDGLDPSAYAVQFFSAYALALAHQMLATAANKLYEGAKNRRKTIATDTLAACYTITKRQVIDLPTYKKWSYKESQWGKKHQSRHWNFCAVRPGRAAPKRGQFKYDWRPRESRWRYASCDLQEHEFLDTLKSRPGFKIPMGSRNILGAKPAKPVAPKEELHLHYFPNDNKASDYLANYRADDWDKQDYYHFRTIRAMVAISGDSVWEEAPLKEDLKDLKDKRDTLHKKYLKPYRAGKVLNEFELRKRKYMRDIARREHLRTKGSFGSEAQHAGIVRAITRNIEEGKKKIASEQNRLDAECNRFVEFLSSPQVQGLIGALPLAKKKAWRTAAVCPPAFAPRPFMGNTLLGFRFFQHYLQWEVWHASGKTGFLEGKCHGAQLLWTDGMEPWDDERKEAPCKVGHDLQVWLEFFSGLENYDSADFEDKTRASLSKAFGLYVKGKETTTLKGLFDEFWLLIKDKKFETTGSDADFQERKADQCRDVLIPLAKSHLKEALSVEWEGPTGPEAKAGPKTETGTTTKTKKRESAPYPKKKSKYPYYTHWEGKDPTKVRKGKVPAAQVLFVDWFSINEDLFENKKRKKSLHTEQALNCLVMLSQAHRNRALREAIKSNSGLLSMISQIAALASAADLAISAVDRTSFWQAIGENTADAIGNARQMKLADSLVQCADETASAAGAALKLFKGVGKFLGYVGLIISVLSAPDVLYSDDSWIVKSLTLVGIGYGVIGVMNLTNPVGWALILIGLGINYLISVYSAPPTLKDATDLGYRCIAKTRKGKTTKEWVADLIIADFELIWRENTKRYAMVVYWPKRRKSIWAHFHRAKTSTGETIVALPYARFPIDGWDGLQIPLRGPVGHVSLAGMKKLAGSMKKVGNDVADLYLTVDRRARKPAKLLAQEVGNHVGYLRTPPKKPAKLMRQRVRISLKTGRIDEANGKAALTVTKLDWLRKVLKKKNILNKVGVDPRIDYLFQVGCSRPGTLAFQLRDSTVRPSSFSLSDGLNLSPDCDTGHSRTRSNQNIIPATAIRSSDGCGISFTDRLLRSHLRFWYTASKKLEHDPFIVCYQYPGMDGANNTALEPWKLGWDRNGRIKHASCVAKRELIFQLNSKKWELALQWSEENCKITFQLWHDRLWDHRMGQPQTIAIRGFRGVFDIGKLRGVLKLKKMAGPSERLPVQITASTDPLMTTDVWTSKAWSLELDGWGNVKDAFKV